MSSFDAEPYIPPDIAITQHLSLSPIDINAPPTHDSEFYIDDQTAVFLVSGSSRAAVASELGVA